MSSSTTEHELFMRRCLDLARLGAGHVAPNPLVGCVIVADGRIIGEGWHQQYGQAHAEVNAIAAVLPADRPLLQKSTLYVNLEPCAHYGHTPPCADRIIAEGIPEVVIANTDVDPRVAGKGIARLREAGIRVSAGVLEKEARQLNRHFFTFHEKKRPFITLKWAQTYDGFISRTGERTAISGETALRFTHQMRATHAAILAGTTTVLTDNPELTVRYADGQNPLRVLIDRQLRIPLTNRVFTAPGKVVVFNEKLEDEQQNIRFVRTHEGAPLLPKIMEYLFDHKVQSLLVEGGAYTLQQFIDAGLWDEAWVYESPQRLHDGVAAPVVLLLPVHLSSLGEDRLFHYIHTA